MLSKTWPKQTALRFQSVFPSNYRERLAMYSFKVDDARGEAKMFALISIETEQK